MGSWSKAALQVKDRCGGNFCGGCISATSNKQTTTATTTTTTTNKQIDRRYLFPETNLHRKSHLSKCDHFWPQLVWVVLWKIGTPFGPGKTSLLINTVRGADNLLLTDNWLLSLKQRSDSNPSHQHLWITSCLPSKNHFWLILDGYCARARYGFITRKSFRSRALEMTR